MKGLIDASLPRFRLRFISRTPLPGGILVYGKSLDVNCRIQYHDTTLRQFISAINPAPEDQTPTPPPHGDDIMLQRAIFHAREISSSVSTQRGHVPLQEWPRV